MGFLLLSAFFLVNLCAGAETLPCARSSLSTASYFLLPSEKAASITSPIGCHVWPSNWTSRSCLIGRKS
jgi:hypothetical protein